MKVKLSTIIITVILSVFYLQIVSCNKVTNPNKAINEIDSKYLKSGQYQKTLVYKFDNDFIFHGWKKQEPIEKQIGEDGSSAWVKKLASSKYFDIYVDTSNYDKAVNIKDTVTVWNELIKDLERRYIRLVNIYGVRGIDLTLKDNRYKVEIIFHENHKDFKNGNAGGYFWRVHNISINANRFLTKYGIESIALKAAIIHELQHYINYYYRGNNATKPYNEALSESIYAVSFTNFPHSHYFGDFKRTTNFINSRNGQYFFNWDGTKDGEITIGYPETAAYFMYWLYIHGGGDKIIKDIVKSKEINHKSIADAARRNIPYYAGFEGDYNPLIFNWHKANFYNNPSWLLGYKGKVKINVHLAKAPGEKIELKPQCAVYTMQDMYDKNKGIEGIWLAKLSDSSRNWLLIYNSGSSTKTVYIRNSNLPIWGKDKTWDPVKLIR